MRKNAFDEGSERDRYTGEASGKTPELKTPSPGLKTLEKALESNLTPPPIGMQTVVCLFQKGFFLICCKASELNALSWYLIRFLQKWILHFWIYHSNPACSEATGIKRARREEAHGAPENPDTDNPKPKKPKAKSTPSEGKGGEAFFKGYSLGDLPKEAWPQPGKNNGQHGYTLRSSNGGVTRTLPGEVFQCLYTQNIPKRYITSVASQPWLACLIFELRQSRFSWSPKLLCWSGLGETVKRTMLVWRANTRGQSMVMSSTVGMLFGKLLAGLMWPDYT